METSKNLKQIIESVFKDDKCNTTSIVEYITESDILFGICEEPEDLDYLKNSYEF